MNVAGAKREERGERREGMTSPVEVHHGLYKDLSSLVFSAMACI